MSNQYGPTRTETAPHARWCERGIWAVLAAGQPDDEVDGLRWRLLVQWTDLHDLKCRCTLNQPLTCCLPVPEELEEWLRSTAATAAPQLRVVN